MKHYQNLLKLQETKLKLIKSILNKNELNIINFNTQFIITVLLNDNYINLVCNTLDKNGIIVGNIPFKDESYQLNIDNLNLYDLCYILDILENK